MSSWRRWYWGVGFVVAFLLGVIVEPSGEVGPLAILLAWAVIGVVAELISVSIASARGSADESLADAAPADAKIAPSRVEGIAATPNSINPALKRFVGIGGDQRVGGLGTRKRAAEPTRLRGRVALVSVFLGRDRRGWNDEEIAHAFQAMERCGVWIEREAMRWGAAVNIELADTYFAIHDAAADDVEITFQAEGESFGPIERGAVVKVVSSLSRSVGVLGFANAVELIEQTESRMDADAVVWLIHVRQAGRSFAARADDIGIPGVNLAVCYAAESSFPEPLGGKRPRFDSATFAHELLHLFGASDKYNVRLDAFPANSVSSRDVMRLDYDNLSALRVDAATAREIGWINHSTPNP